MNTLSPFQIPLSGNILLIIYTVNVTFPNHLCCIQCRTRRLAKCTMYNTMCSGQTPSLNLTNRTCGKNRVNWNKPCRFFSPTSTECWWGRGDEVQFGLRGGMSGMEEQHLKGNINAVVVRLRCCADVQLGRWTSGHLVLLLVLRTSTRQGVQNE